MTMSRWLYAFANHPKVGDAETLAKAAALAFEAGMVVRPEDLLELTQEEIGALVAGRKQALASAVGTALEVLGEAGVELANDDRLEQLVDDAFAEVTRARV